jgi:hypothetical protein
MEFSNTANSQGLLQDVDFLCGTTTASYPTVDKVRNINQAYHDVTQMIWNSCDNWQYDDSNATDYPMARTSLTDNTMVYAIPSTARRIKRVEIMAADGNWVKLLAYDYKDIKNEAILEDIKDVGLPVYYDLVGNFIYLYPTPTSTYVTNSSGMAVYVDRDVTLFTSASTTAVPGFAPQFHRILSLQAAIDFEKDANQRQLFIAEKTQLVDGMRRFYGTRNVEKRIEITPSNKRYRHIYE